jgi:hypothetical protein
MRKLTVLLMTLLWCFSNAQVKEICFLGKNWYLHGYDFKVKMRDYSEGFYSTMSQEALVASPAYDTVMNTAYKQNVGYLPRKINTLSIGMVFRPFHRSQIPFIKQFEFSHTIEIERLNTIAAAGYEGSGFTDQMLIKTFEIGYNPRFIINSNTFADYLKLYMSVDGYAFIPISNSIYTQIDDSYLINKTDGYNKQDAYFTDRLSSSHFKYGGGLSAGIKMNLNCNWNFHIEASTFDVYTRYWESKRTAQSGNIGIQIGLRYKFGVPSENENDTEYKPPVFW